MTKTPKKASKPGVTVLHAPQNSGDSKHMTEVHSGSSMEKSMVPKNEGWVTKQVSLRSMKDNFLLCKALITT